jgi:xylan 1,4-beta-xylosidase
VILQQGVRDQPEVSGLASLDRHGLRVLVWHYHDDDIPGPQAAVEMVVNGLPSAVSRAKVEHFRIDEDHSNSFTAWKRMGSPQSPTPDQYAALEKAGQLAALGPAEMAKVEKGSLVLRFLLPRQGVSLLTLEWGESPN